MNDQFKLSAVVYWPLEKLIPFEDNAKLHPPEQIDALVKSIKMQGYRNKPIEITPEGVIINGHGRWMALKQMGATQAPCAVIDDMTPDEIRQYRITDNKVGDTGFDNELLKKEVLYLQFESELDMSSWFTEKEFDFLVGDLAEMNLDAITDNLAGDVDGLSSATQNSMDGEKVKLISISKAFGYVSINETDQRSIARLQAHAEGVTGLKEGAALSLFVKDHLGL